MRGKLLTNDLIHNSSDYNAAGSPSVRWLDGSSYTALEQPHQGSDAASSGQRSSEEGTPGGTGGGGTVVATGRAKEIVKYDAVDGRRSVLVSLADLTPEGASNPLEIHDYSWSGDGTKLLIFTESQKVWRQNTRGDYYVVDVSGSGAPIVQLGRSDFDEHCLMFAKFSPKGAPRVGFVYHNNIYVQTLATMDVVQLTHDGLPGHGGMAPIINGNFDWVYEEELSIRDGWRWSPDGQRVAYWQLQTSDVQWFSLVNNTADPPYAKVTEYPYPKVGTKNPVATIGVVSANGGGETRWLDVAPLDGSEHYIARMEWAPASSPSGKNGGALLVQRIPREQKVIEMLLVDCSETAIMAVGDADTTSMPTPGGVTILIEERDAAWVDVRDDGFHLFADGSFTWYSERSGYRHLYLGAFPDNRSCAHRKCR